MNAAQDALYRGRMVHDEMSQLAHEMSKKLNEMKRNLKKKGLEIKNLENDFERACDANELIQGKIMDLKHSLKWGKDLSQDLCLRLLDKAPNHNPNTLTP